MCCSEEEIEGMEKQINTWESESISSRGEVAQNLKSKLSETQEKPDRLVSLYLDGDIERDLYLVKKDALLRQKAKLEESLGDFGQQGKNRLEPLRSFVLSLKEAEKAAQTKNYAEWRNFFRALGSNPEIKDKTLSINWGELWDFTAKTKADFALRSAGASPRGAVNSEQVSFGAFIQPSSHLFSKSLMLRTRGARGGSDQNRTLGFRPATAR
jgi:hypothetical protein